MAFSATKRVSFEQIISAKTSSEHLALFIEFFTRFYGLTIQFEDNSYSVYKSGTRVIITQLTADYEKLIMLLIIQLIIYCENPF